MPCSVPSFLARRRNLPRFDVGAFRLALLAGVRSWRVVRSLPRQSLGLRPAFSRASEIAHGQFPCWLDILGGFPLYQTPHFSATYPFYFFGLLNYGNALEVLYTLSYVTCFHTLILYLNLYVMLRVAGARGLASLCGATIGLVSGNTEVNAHWIAIAAAWSWFPLLVAGMIRMLRAPLSFGSIALFSLSAALICAANPAQPVIQSVFVCGIFSSLLRSGGGERTA